jgi:hypothetical protein
MTMLSLPRIISVFPTLLLIFNLNVYAQDEGMGTAVSPMRLSYADGNVSFRRYGAKDWVGAQVNTPIAVGDSLYVGKDGDLELQMGSRAFVRADDDTQFTLANQTPDFAQFNITSGRVTFDLRVLPAGYSVELDTPNAVFTIDHAGYYRVDVDGDVHFITRRGGRAIVVPAGGQAMSINPSEEIVVQGTAVAQAETYVAPELDQWDRWNYDRSDGLLDAVSQRYIPYGVAGASCRITGRCGCPTRSRRGGRLTAPAAGYGIPTISGHGSTPRRGDGHHSIMAAGFPWAVIGRGLRDRW